MPEQSDDLLAIQMTLQGQQPAYATLVNKYQSYVFTLALRYVNDREVAEELAQDVFVKAYRHLADFKGNSKFSTWLYTIVHTTCLSHIRKKKDDAILLEEEKMITISDNRFSQNPSERMEQKTQKQMLKNALNHLSAADAQLLTLFYLAEQSVDEIGIILGLTATNVKVRLFRATQKLREILKSRYGRELIG